VFYHGPLRAGTFGCLTEPMDIFICGHCGLKWHPTVVDLDTYYQSEEYRVSVNGSDYINENRKAFDKSVLEKFLFTKTDVYRDEAVADIGCANGFFLDFLTGAVKDTIAVEPSEAYGRIINPAHHVYRYTKDALRDWRGKVGVVTSFDVLEHVEDQQAFIDECCDLLKPGGRLFIGVCSDYPVLRNIMGDAMNEFAYSVQHLWYNSRKSLQIFMQNARGGVTDFGIQSYQRYGLGNLLTWALYKEPKGDVKFDFISETLENTFKSEIAVADLGDYFVLSATK
jgi:SAM-dependent methyltransferase